MWEKDGESGRKLGEDGGNGKSQRRPEDRGEWRTNETGGRWEDRRKTEEVEKDRGGRRKREATGERWRISENDE